MIFHRGLTLTELIVCLSILSLLFYNFSSPSMQQQKMKHDIEFAMGELDAAISMARASAITENVMTTWCRSDDGLHCQGSWDNGSILFTDYNADHQLNGRDRLLMRFPPLKPAGTLRFSSFRNQQYLQLTPRGATNSQNGNFTFCPGNGDPALIRQLIINVTGRARMAQDLDHDGIVEDSQGKPVLCQ